MPQKTNLNISPYYDDFDKDDQFYKILFKPGYPVQARELTGIQSLLQNQIESFGKHMFKEGSMVIPGAIEFDNTYFSAKVNDTHLGIDVSIYLNEIITSNGGKGLRVRGQTSGIVATIKNFILPPAEGVEKITVFLKYQQSGTDGESAAFPDGEVLVLEEPLTYGNTTITIGETVLTLASEDATATGSAFGVNAGVYFIRGSFVDVPSSLIVLDPYSINPSFRVGFDVSEEIINSNDDPSLYDNAKGFTNFAAPGADRFKISVKLSKKVLTDYEDTNFVELMRVDDGAVKKLQDTSAYAEIKKYFAKRTYDESGDYSVDPFRVSIEESLNNEIDTDGLFTDDRLTDDGNIPDDDIMCVKVFPGRAYVKGYDVDLNGTTILDIEKPRDTQNIQGISVPFEMGSLIRVNNAEGVPNISIGGGTTNIINLHGRRKTGSNAASGPQVGEARVYYYSLTDDTYKDQTSSFDLYLYDIQTFTILKCSSFTEADLVKGMKIRGLSSGAEGFAAKNGGVTGDNEIVVSQTTGTFIKGEQIVINERISGREKPSVKEIVAFTIDDVKSIFQDADAINSELLTDFSADTVLYDRVLPGFSLTDTINVVGTAATAANRNFAGKVGIQTGSIISFSDGNSQVPVYNEVTNISVEGKTLTLAATTSVVGVNVGSTVATNKTTSSTFRIKVPKVLNIESSGIFAALPKSNVELVDFGTSDLTISKQITGGPTSINSSTITFNSSVGLTTSVGITSVFFEPYDTERYSIHYSDGTTETLRKDQVTITNNASTITFSGLSKSSGNATVNVTLKKLGITSKSKDYLRSQTLEVTRTRGVATPFSGLVHSRGYGLRVEDEEISLNVPDVVKIHAVYESKDTNTPVLDKLTFVSGLSLNASTIIGEQIKGLDSRAIGQVVSRTANSVDFVYLNDNRFTIGEVVFFNESAVETVLQGVTLGNFIDRTSNYTLDKGHKAQYCDYSKIIRNFHSAVPSKKLLIVFDKYQVASGNNGDFFTVNSYPIERYTKDLPIVDGIPASDILDYRPRVVPYSYSGGGASPFAFTSRAFESTNPFIITPNESALLGLNHYLGRIDKLLVNYDEGMEVFIGESSEDPVEPSINSDAMEVATIILPPYLYDISDAEIRMKDNRRFTMRDIGALEKRIENLEQITSLTALELDTKSFQIKDADGLNRFKTGFVVNDFKDRSFIDFSEEGGSKCDVDIENKELISSVDFWSMNPELALDEGIDVKNADMNSNLQLLDEDCKKTGDLITLDFEEVDWIEQPQATTVENVNPFNVVAFSGLVVLDPPSDNWARTIYVNNVRKESTGARWVESTNIVSDVKTRGKTTTKEDVARHRLRNNRSQRFLTHTTKVTRRIEKSFTNTLVGPSEEKDYIESTKVSSVVDPFMRSRNVGFYASGLKPLTNHYHFLDSGVPDIVPKLTEIEMVSGTFSVFEDVKVELNGTEIGLIRSQEPNHKYGDENRPEVQANLGTPNVKVEKYIIDPYDRTRPAPSSTYSATSKLFNTDVIGLANNEKYFGYLIKGAKLTGKTSGAVATVTNTTLISDNWGDLIGSFFFRNANKIPKPPTLFTTGTKTFKVTSQPDGTIPLPGDLAMLSSSTGTFLGTGTILTQNNFIVQVRNPPRPPKRENEVTVSVDDEVVNEIQDIFIEARRSGGWGRVLRGRQRRAPGQAKAKAMAKARNAAKNKSSNKGSTSSRSSGGYGGGVGNKTNRRGSGFSSRRGRRGKSKGRGRGSRKSGGRDPLCQSFSVNETGAFLTSFDVFFASKDPNVKLTVELRTMELGTPTNYLVQDFCQLVVSPEDINVSNDASVPTTFRFTSPVYLPPDEEFALVFSAPASDKYTMWCATMGEKSVKTTQLPDVQNVVVSKQYVGGSLFKSQNGTIWTPSQNQDLAFKLRKANFVNGGTVRLYNTPIEPGNLNTQLLVNNPVRSLPRKLKVSIDGAGTRTNANLPIGRKVSTGAAGDSEDQSVTGIIEGQGAAIGTSELVSGGVGYSVSGTVTTISLTGSGSGATVSVTISNGVITAYNVISNGGGYQVGDVLTLDNSHSGVDRGSGFKFTVTAINSTFDTLYLTDVQGEKFTNDEPLVEYGSNNDTRSVITNVAVNGDSVQNGDLFAGNVFEITQYNHAHHGANNKVEIQNIKPDTLIVPSTSALTAESTVVSLGNTTPFATFSGIATDRGEALIEEEIVSYVVGAGQLTLTRGVLNTVALPHPEGSSIQTYEAAGISLVGINTVHTIPTNTTLKDNSDIDNYYLEFNRTILDPLNQRTGNSLLCFRDEKAFGGNTAKISQNHQFSSLDAQINFITPGTSTDLKATVRTISGTSAGGSEVSFIDQGVEPISLNTFKFFETPRLIASTVNEDKLTELPKQKSFHLDLELLTGDSNLSPVIDLKNATFIFGRNKINNPVGLENYATDSRTNQLLNDPHGSVFVSERVDLEQPATSLKVLVAANVLPEADFRVFYKLYCADSSEVALTYRAFPGFKNLIDTDGDGFGDQVIDDANNDGRPDALVTPAGFNQFKDYQFTADDLQQFTGFTIKIVMMSTNECSPVRIKDLRILALA